MGFHKCKATTGGGLLSAVENWHKLLQSDNKVCAVLFDFRKAFDTLSHELLLRKLSSLDLNPYILSGLQVT